MASKVKKDNSNKTCGFCGGQDSTMKSCSRCKLVYYCGYVCQQAHWKQKNGGHKKFCIPIDQRKPENQASSPPATTVSSNCDKCSICLDGIKSKDDCCELPCSHIFHACCMEEFRSHAAAQEENSRCPLCRTDLDSSLKSQFLKGCKLYDEIKRRKEMRLLNCVTTEDADEALAEYSQGEAEVIRLWEGCARAGFLPAKNAIENVELFTKGDQSANDKLIKDANEGNAEAQVDLGQYYFSGQFGFAIDDKKARYWFKKAADQGSTDGQGMYGACLSGGFGGAIDLKTGLSWRRKSAAQGNPKAQLDLGHAYEEGKGVEKNIATAKRWFEKAALQGDKAGAFNLANLYLKAKEYEKSFPWMKKAAELGHAQAQLSLGCCFYGAGVGGTQQNEEVAISWVIKSAQQGDTQAIEALQEMGVSVPEAPSPTASRFL